MTDKQILKDVTKKWGKTHEITKVWGTEVILPNLPEGISVCYGDGKTYYFQLKKKPVYNLTFWQKVELFFLKPYWYLTVSDNKKTWHEVKKGMEKHEHKFTKVFSKQGYRFAQCEHEGCNLCEYLD